MTTGQSTHRFLLRAALLHRESRIITHTIEMSESLIFVLADEDAYVGDTVMIELSFPGLVEPFSIETQVIARRDGSMSGQFAGWLLGFVFYREVERVWLRNLLHRSMHDDASHGSYTDVHARTLPVATPGRYRVLLIDDNELTRQAFSHAGRKLFGPCHDSVELDVVPGPDEGWSRLQHSKYDLVITDYYLSMSSGERLIADLRADRHLAKLPIIAISTGDPEVREATLAAGADFFVPKPLVTRHLFHTLYWLVRPMYPSTSLQRSAG